MMPDSVLYAIEDPRPESIYALEFLLMAAGVRPVRTQHRAAVFYGSHVADGVRLHIAPGTAALPVNLRFSTEEGKTSFDIVRVAFELISDRVNADSAPSNFDRHSRLLFAQSWQARTGLADQPVVNQLVQSFREALRQTGVASQFLPLWPAGKRGAICLSHDVDIPDKYALLNLVRYNPGRIASSPKMPLRIANSLRKRLRDPAPNDYWQFDAVLEEEEKRGFRSTFFFASTPSHDEMGAPEDVDYDVRWPHFRTALSRIRTAGWEIGLHAGYNAFKSTERFRVEKERLEVAAGVQVKGLRHHFWHLGPDPEKTLAAHEAAGFGYDSSLGFNEHPGFRRNIALPYFPWSAASNRPLTTLQIPPFCMDGNFFYHSNDVEDAVISIEGYVDTLATHEGLGAIDWHVRTSVPRNTEYKEWGRAYLRVLDLLAQRADLWVTTMAEAESWWRKRAAQLTPS